MKRIFFSVIVILIAVSFLIISCGKTSSDQSNKIRVATNPTWPPFELVDENTKEIIGFDIDIMRAIADKEGLEVEFVNVPWDSLLAGMAQCQYDAAISAITITEERKKNFNFSDPYFAVGLIITVRADNTDINGKDGLSGKRVGVQLGTTGETAADKLAGVDVRKYDDIGLVFQDLMNGQLDAVIADNTLGYVNENPNKLKTVGDTFNNEYYGIAVCKTKTELLDKLNDGLAKIKAESVLDQLIGKWISKNN